MIFLIELYTRNRTVIARFRTVVLFQKRCNIRDFQTVVTSSVLMAMMKSLSIKGASSLAQSSSIHAGIGSSSDSLDDALKTSSITRFAMMISPSMKVRLR